MEQGVINSNRGISMIIQAYIPYIEESCYMTLCVPDIELEEIANRKRQHARKRERESARYFVMT